VSAIEQMLAGVEMAAVEPAPDQAGDGLPTVTHSGRLRLDSGLEIEVLQLSDGQRIIPADDFARVLAWLTA
jgi:hypothetical protein